MRRCTLKQHPLNWLCTLTLIIATAGILLFSCSTDRQEPPAAHRQPPSELLFFDPGTNLKRYQTQWAQWLWHDYGIGQDTGWQPTSLTFSGHVLLADQSNHAGTEVFAFVSYDPNDPGAQVYLPAFTTTDAQGGFTIQFTDLAQATHHLDPRIRIHLVSPPIMPPDLRIFIRHPGYDGLVLTAPIPTRQTTFDVGSVQLLDAGAHAARIAAPFGGQTHGYFKLFNNEQCDPQHILAEYAANPNHQTCDDAMFYFLTAILQSGWGRQWHTDEDFHEGFLAFRQHFMDGKDNTGQLITRGFNATEDAGWAAAFEEAETAFYDRYFKKLFRDDPQKALDHLTNHRHLLPLAVTAVRFNGFQFITRQPTPEVDRIFYTMLNDPSVRFSAMPNTASWKDQRAVPLLIAMLQEQPALSDKERRRVHWNLSNILGEKGHEARDIGLLTWWEAESRRVDWPKSPEPIRY